MQVHAFHHGMHAAEFIAEECKDVTRMLHAGLSVQGKQNTWSQLLMLMGRTE